MNRKMSLVFVALLVAAAGVLLGTTQEALAGRGDGPVIYVTGQNLAYDSIIAADPLPQHGPFQELEMGGPTGLQTEYGPGDREYRGGRWWMDTNDNGMMDEEDHYFSCPLLGPGMAISP